MQRGVRILRAPAPGGRKLTAASTGEAAVAAGWLRGALLVAVALAFGGLYYRLFVTPALGGFVPPQAIPREAPSAAPLCARKPAVSLFVSLTTTQSPSLARSTSGSGLLPARTAAT